jgi:hypothetical protein
MRAVADAADVHAGAEADVFEGGKRFDFAFVVNVLFGVSHGKGINSELRAEKATGKFSGRLGPPVMVYWIVAGRDLKKTDNPPQLFIVPACYQAEFA